MTHHVEPSAAATTQSADAMEERLRRLEDRVATLTEAVRVLAHGLEDLPVAEPAGNRAAAAARRAHDLLLTVGSAQSPTA
jgi:hypothetical protein